jgi:hypothetical protein
VESTTPPLYQTPGLPDDTPAGSGPTSAVPPKPNLKPDGEPMIDPATLSPVFVATGKIYGAPAGQPSNLTLQALKSASLIVRGADGSIYFARQFAPGEAYRTPALTGLTAAQTSLTQLAQGGAAAPRVASTASVGAAKPAAAAVKPAPAAAKPAAALEAPH